MTGLRQCSLCGAQVRRTTINYTQELDGKLYLVTDVPAEVCPQCGEQYLSPETVDALQEMIERGTTPRTIQVPVFRFRRVAS